MKMDLHSFLEAFKGEIIEVKKKVKLEHIGALVAQAEDTVVFDQIEGYPGFRLVDRLFSTRKAQARVLGCKPTEVVKRLAEVIRKGPAPLREVERLIEKLVS